MKTNGGKYVLALWTALALTGLGCTGGGGSRTAAIAASNQPAGGSTSPPGGSTSPTTTGTGGASAPVTRPHEADHLTT